MDSIIAYRALVSHDSRFDGIFFVGVTSTGIYCRPICPAKTPKLENCRFFTTTAAAEKAAFRPCLRCRPELAPGNAPIDQASRIANLLLDRIKEGSIDKITLEEMAADLKLSTRQLRRIVQKELGVSPIELLQTNRLLLAKQLLTETILSMTEIAFASGFSSLRRFNDAFVIHYKMPPSQLRKTNNQLNLITGVAATSKVQLVYRPPYDWDSMLEFLAARRIQQVEFIFDKSYLRTVSLGKRQGWIKVSHAIKQQALIVEFTHSLLPVLSVLLNRLRHLFDLNARPDLITSHLMKDKILQKSLIKNPGLRVPGAFDGFEMMVRAILGQQITVKAATTLACRFAAKFGEKINTPFPELTRLSPLPEFVAQLTIEAIASLGIISARAKSILLLAKAFETKQLQLIVGEDPEKIIKNLIDFPGIGQWTAHYIAMRALRWPDAFPKEDIAIRNALGGITAKQAEIRSQSWRPWRSYAVLHIWKNLLN